MTDYPNFFDKTGEATFAALLPKYAPQRILQLGAFTGDATVWMVNTLDPQVIVDVDAWGGTSSEKWTAQFDWADVEATYDAKTAEWRSTGQVVKEKTSTRDYLACAIAGGIEPFDLIYIDADHTTQATLENAVMSYPILATGGLMVFDDYVWQSDSGRLLDDPMPAIDAFKYLYLDRMRFVALGSQYWLQKMR